MNDSHPSNFSTKALPPLAKLDDLPPPPPPPRDEVAPPMLPPKITLDRLPNSSPGPRSASLPKSPDALSLPNITSPPGSPMPFNGFGPPSPTSATPADRPKKSNPFVDLIETEKSYVDALSGIIRKVASAWSRSNLPPTELDIMFRSIEAIFKANRSFYSKLKEIGPNPSSPRAIGDLLMKWVDQLDAPYTSYCSSYLTGFDSWEPVTCNQRLPGILSAFSSSNPPFQSNLQVWTIDTLLALPRFRIKYYQKLYSRLLKNSAPGRSTDKKLIEVNEKLERLLATAEERTSISLPGSGHVIETTDEVVIGTNDVSEVPPKVDTELTNTRETKELSLKKQMSPVDPETRTSLESSTRGSVLSGSQTSSRETPLTSDGRASTQTLSMSLSDLESRLAVERCRDLFTMNLRSVRLSLNSLNIPYTREIRLSEDAVISFTPKSTNIGIVHRQGRIFLLTDLFLICERMTQEDRNRCDSEVMDMWLCYPPLAAKHLRVSCIEDDKLEITILKKEVMIFQFDSQGRRDYVFREFVATSTAAATLPPPSKQAPPPVPPLGNIVQAQNLPSSRNSESVSDFDGSSRIASPISTDNATRTFDSSRPSSEGTSRSGSAAPTPNHEFERPGPPPYSANVPSEPDVQTGFSGRPYPNGEPFRPPPRGESSRSPPHQPVIGGAGNFSSLPDMREPQSFAPGQIIPPHRSGSIGSGPPHGGPFPQRPPVHSPPINGGPYPPGGMPPANGMNSPPRNMMSPPPMNGMNGPLPPRGMMSPPPGSGGPMHGPPHMAGYGPMQGGPPGPITLPPRSGSLGPQPMSAGPRSDFMQGRPGPGPMQPGLPPHPGAPFAQPGRPSSDPSFQGGIRKTPSLHSISSQHDSQRSLYAAAGIPPVPNRMDSVEGGSSTHLRPMLPSAALPRIASGMAPQFGIEDSPPTSPTELAPPTGPVETSVRANMKCKVFLQQQHAQWKSLGSAKLTLYEQQPTNVKQLVVEADNKEKTMLISTIVLTDGVERVGKTGVAIELSDNGARTGIIYMLQLRNEKSAGGLFESLLVGSDRGAR